MDDLIQLARLIDARNQTEREITGLIGRPAAIGHIGEYIASRIFNIVLEESASHKGSDGHFGDGPIRGRTVNIKWYALQEGILDITPESLPDFYLVLTGCKSDVIISKLRTRPWTIERVFLFNAVSLVDGLKATGVKIGTATSIRKKLWDEAEIYPTHRSNLFPLLPAQRDALSLFCSQ